MLALIYNCAKSINIELAFLLTGNKVLTNENSVFIIFSIWSVLYHYSVIKGESYGDKY